MLSAPPHLIRRTYLFVDVQHGLCNRLRAMASAAVVAGATGRELVVVWRPDHHCQARLSDLLDYSGTVLEDGVETLKHPSDLVYNYMEIEPGARYEAPILEDAERADSRNVFIRSAYVLNSRHRTPEAERAFLRSLRPVDQVLDLVARVRHPNTVAAHIRMGTGQRFDHLSYESPANWPAHRHADMTEWREKSDARHFQTRLDQLVQSGRADTIFLAADLSETYESLSRRFGDRVTWLERGRFDRSAEQIQYALADLLLLTSADLLLASTASSFSDLAQALALPERPCERSGIDF